MFSVFIGITVRPLIQNDRENDENRFYNKYTLMKGF